MQSAVEEWYYNIPIVSRVWFTSAIVSALGARLSLLNPYTLAFFPTAVFSKFQVREG